MAPKVITKVDMKTTTVALLLSLFASFSAFASQPKRVNMPLGYTTTLSMPTAVSKVTVDDPSLVEVRKEGRKVVLVAIAKGLTEATVTTADGEHRFKIFVAADKYAMP